MKKSLRPLPAGGAAIAIAFACPALAQDPVPRQAGPGVPAGEAADVSDIIITATRRASPLSDVPIAVSAVTAEALRNSGASDIRQLNQLAPSLLVASTGSEANGTARIRGIGTVGDNPGLESSVAIFIDGVYRSRTGTGLNELGEIERVEVLRGPQGTLFGRNASAGILNIVSKAPEFAFAANGEVTYGNYDYWRLSGRVTGPVTDSLALSLDGVRVRRDGFYDLVDASGARVGGTNDRDRWFLRGQALFEPTDALSIRIIGDYSRRDESCCGAAYTGLEERIGTSPFSYGAAPANRIVTILRSLGATFPDPGDPFSRNLAITPGRDYVSDLRDWGVSGEINYDFGGAKLTGITAWRDYRSADYGDYDYSSADLLFRDPGTFRRFRTFTQELRLQGSGFGGRLDWLVGGYFAHETLTLQDNIRFGDDYGPFAACRLLAGAGPTASPLLHLGLLDPAAPGCMTAPARAAVTAQLGPLAPLLVPGLDALSTIGSAGISDARYRQKSENWALFTHNIFHVTDRLDLTVGVRYTHERKRFSAAFDNRNAVCSALQARNPGAPNDLYEIATNPAFGGAAQLAQGMLTLGCLGNASPALNALDLRDHFGDGEFSGTGVLSWRATDDLMAYASYSRGYKAGGYNLDRFELGNNGLTPVPAVFSPRSDADAADLRFAAETVDAFELGLKFSQRHWSANIAAFREEFTDFQLNTFNGTSFVVQNINGCDGALSTAGTCARGDVKPGLVSQGVELELTASPVRTLNVTGGFTYTRAKYASRLVGSKDGSVPLDRALFLLPGSTAASAPRLVTTASIAWTPSIGDGGLSGLVYADGRMTSDYNTGSDLFPEKAQDGFAIVNARIGVRGPEQKWAVEFWGQNVFNARYRQVAISTPLQSSSPATSTVAQLGTRTAMVNQLFSAYLAEPRTYGVTLRGRF